ncbi:unnamed protein product [Triticum turgidum subsp. durum]|uniref:Uncharacterized protein n=1 Tax=Triticum turgidum subsp. durum TaxID=4567 RepID=A0A9R0YWB1_TRITD|nr:unnamed protein product [Triticum turgidum subsp. durum]
MPSIIVRMEDTKAEFHPTLPLEFHLMRLQLLLLPALLQRNWRRVRASIPKQVIPLSHQTVRKSLSYKEVAIAAPGTLAKVLNDVHTEQKDTTDPAVNLESAKAPKESNVRPSEEKNGAIQVSPKDNNLQVSKATDEHKSPSSDTEQANGSEGSNQAEKTSDSAETSTEKNQSSAALADVPNEEEATLTEANDSSSNDDERGPGEDNQEQLSSGAENEKSSPSGSEKNDSPVEGAKETASKLNAAAAPFSPATVPAFGSMAVPGFREHGGLLPSPANVPPMLAIPLRKHPHQSATARVPYGPRLAGGFNRSGHRVPRNKPVLPSGEVLPEAATSPKVMNPHAAEFVPGQSRSPDGHPSSPNESLASPAGIQASQDGLPSSPNSTVESPKTASPQVSETSETSPEGNDTSSGIHVEAEAESKNTEEKNNHVECEDSEVKPDETIVSGGAEVDATAPIDAQDDASAPKDAQDDSSMTEKPKSWADYSDGEVEAVQVAS